MVERLPPWGIIGAMRWPWQRSEQPKAAYAPVDALVAGFFSPAPTISGVAVDERSALSLSAVFRAVSLVAGTLASLETRSMRKSATGPERVPSVFDDPDGPDGQTPYEWKETLFLHAMIHGGAFALKLRNDAGSVARLPLLHPLCVTAEEPSVEDYRRGTLPEGGKWFRVRLADGTAPRYDAHDVWHMPAISSDGFVGMGLLQMARLSLGTTLAGDKAAGNMFSNGAMISGLATPDDDDDITSDVPEIRRQLNRSTGGVENAGRIAVVNRRLRFTPWTMTAADAQFLQSRQFQIEEISRWTGVPPHLLMQTEKQTSWGTGVDEQNRGLSKFVLGHWAQRFEQRASRLLAMPRWVELDFASLERPNFATNVDLVLRQIDAGLISPAYGRELLNIPESAAPETPTSAPAAPGGNDAPAN